MFPNHEKSFICVSPMRNLTKYCVSHVRPGSLYGVPLCTLPRTSDPSVKVNSTYADRVNLVAPASPIECLLHLPNDRAIQYKLGPEKLTRLGNSNVLRLPVLPYIIYLMYNIVNYVSPYVKYCVSHVQYSILCFPLRTILCILCTVSNINVFPPMYRSYMCSIYLNFVPN